MDFNQYQDLALKTANSTVVSDNKQGLLNTALGLCGESGEFADAIKKVTFQGHEIDREKLIKELGDVLWYIALGAHSLSISLDQIASINIDKLQKRYPQGFNIQQSLNRVEYCDSHNKE